MGCSPCLLSDGVGKGSWVLFLRVPSCHVPLQPNFPSVLGPGLSRSSSGYSSSLAQSLLEGGDVGCRGLCHNEMKGLGRMSLLGSQKEPFPSSSRPKALPRHLLSRRRNTCLLSIHSIQMFGCHVVQPVWVFQTPCLEIEFSSWSWRAEREGGRD